MDDGTLQDQTNGTGQATEIAAKKKLDPKYLAGLTYRDASLKNVKNPDSGENEKKMVPFERELKVTDVMDWTETDTEVVIVTKDGQKYRVKKGKK